MPKYIPHRGDGFSKDFEPRKKYINLRHLRRNLVKTTLSVLVILSIITFGFLQIPADSNGKGENGHIALIAVIWVFAFVLLAGIWNLNKFRKGYDVDTSDKPVEDEYSNRE